MHIISFMHLRIHGYSLEHALLHACITEFKAKFLTLAKMVIDNEWEAARAFAIQHCHTPGVHAVPAPGAGSSASAASSSAVPRPPPPPPRR